MGPHVRWHILCSKTVQHIEKLRTGEQKVVHGHDRVRETATTDQRQHHKKPVQRRVLEILPTRH